MISILLLTIYIGVDSCRLSVTYHRLRYAAKDRAGIITKLSYKKNNIIYYYNVIGQDLDIGNNYEFLIMKN